MCLQHFQSTSPPSNGTACWETVSMSNWWPSWCGCCFPHSQLPAVWTQAAQLHKPQNQGPSLLRKRQHIKRKETSCSSRPVGFIMAQSSVKPLLPALPVSMYYCFMNDEFSYEDSSNPSSSLRISSSQPRFCSPLFSQCGEGLKPSCLRGLCFLQAYIYCYSLYFWTVVVVLKGKQKCKLMWIYERMNRFNEEKPTNTEEETFVSFFPEISRQTHFVLL